MHMRNKGIYKKCAHKNCLNHLARQWDVNRTRRLGARQGNYSRVFLRLVDAPRLLRLFSRDIHTTNLLVAAVRLDASAYKQCKVRNTRNRTTQVSQRSPLFTGGISSKAARLITRRGRLRIQTHINMTANTKIAIWNENARFRAA